MELDAVAIAEVEAALEEAAPIIALPTPLVAPGRLSGVSVGGLSGPSRAPKARRSAPNTF
ncbi:MAG TPA: hypothetical protein VNK89_08180 [Thermoflexus sp.]|nr:hypothetical protein [Thermoflexus sp.]